MAGFIIRGGVFAMPVSQKIRLLFAILAGLLGAPALAAFTDNGNGTVSDTATGLMWQRCSMGQTWDGSTCAGNATGLTWDAAVAAATTDSFAGQTGWRLPDLTELQSLVKAGSIPSIDSVTFPNTPGSIFWSSTDYIGNSNVGWNVSFSSGYSSYNVKSYAYQVRLVRTAQSAAAFPVCTLIASPASISAGGIATLTASCSPAATSYSWTGGTCVGDTTSTCTVTPSVTTTYTVAGLSASGYGASAGATVTVTAAPTPVCALTASPASISAGNSSTLTVSCSPAATSYLWVGGTCAGTSGSSCTVNPSTTTTYSVLGSNASGTGSYANATVTVTSPVLTVTPSGTGYGNVASSPAGISCYAPEPNVNYLIAPDCSESYVGGISVTLTATPSSGSFFSGWNGDCTGTGSCIVTMSTAKNVTAIFKPVPFVASTTSNITATSATITTSIAFNAADKGKQGAVFITAWVPANGLGTFGISTAASSKALNVTATSENPYLAGKVNSGQMPLNHLLAAADPNSFVLIQRTTSGWQLVVDGQLIPYASGVLGDSLAAQSILNNTDPTNLTGAQFCVGYGTSAADMIKEGRMIPVAAISDSGSTVTTNGSCNVATNPYKGLWWNSAESGWGMSVTQHDNINFVALYTYDQSAQPVWYVMSSCPIVTAGSCSGYIYKVTGGTSPAVSWNGASKAVSTAGIGKLTFSDANHGTFEYTLNGIASSKNIERQFFSNGTAQVAVDYTDLWWNANESGWGVALTQDHGMIFAAWYVYSASGNPVWYVASSCPLSGSGCTGDLYQVTGGAALTATWNASLAVTKVGTVSFSFSDGSTGTMNYTINGVAGTKAITRQAF